MASDLSPSVAIVILNWNGRLFLEQFLPNVIKYSTNCQVIVADNASTDDSILFLKENFPGVKTIQHQKNLGFCDGYNKALAQISADYFVLLNSDVAVTPDWTIPIISLLETNKLIAACQPKIKSFSDPNFFEYAGAGGGFIDCLGYPFCRGRLFETLEQDEGQYDDTIQIFWASGACLFVRATAYWEIGGLEPAFFAHMEEIDLCWRLQNNGYKIMYCGSSEVYHVGGGTLHKSNPRKTYLNFRNGLALLYKNLPANILNKIISLRILLDWVAALKFLLDGDWKDARAVLKAHLDVWQNRRYWQKRRSLIPAKNRNVEGIYKRSIVWDYFFKRRKVFGELKIPDGAALPT